MQESLIVGWREWVRLPQTGAPPFRAKIDTGARSSALHAFGLRTERRDDLIVALFRLAPDAEAPEQCFQVIASRTVRSSNGTQETRPTIRVTLTLGTLTLPVAVTLTDRARMKYRMLIGREALAGRVLVDPGRAHLLGRKRPE